MANEQTSRERWQEWEEKSGYERTKGGSGGGAASVPRDAVRTKKGLEAFIAKSGMTGFKAEVRRSTAGSDPRIGNYTDSRRPMLHLVRPDGSSVPVIHAQQLHGEREAHREQPGRSGAPPIGPVPDDMKYDPPPPKRTMGDESERQPEQPGSVSRQMESARRYGADEHLKRTDVKAWAEAQQPAQPAQHEAMFAKSASLPDDPDKYFKTTRASKRISVDQLVTTRARPDGIAHAEELMAQAHAGVASRRKPISVRKLPDGKYEVVDGNSTTAIAKKHGWKEVIAEEVGTRGWAEHKLSRS